MSIVTSLLEQAITQLSHVGLTIDRLIVGHILINGHLVSDDDIDTIMIARRKVERDGPVRYGIFLGQNTLTNRGRWAFDHHSTPNRARFDTLEDAFVFWRLHEEQAMGALQAAVQRSALRDGC